MYVLLSDHKKTMRDFFNQLNNDPTDTFIKFWGDYELTLDIKTINGKKYVNTEL